MVKVQQQSLAAIKKSKPEEIVVEEGKQRPQDDVDETEPNWALGDNHLRPERRVAVHVLDVVGQSGVRVVDEGTGTNVCYWAGQLHILMDGARFESATLSSKET